MSRVFLDTEWADLNGTPLVSLALVSQDCQRRLYVESELLPKPGSDFFEHVVYPRLERGCSAKPEAELASAVHAFLVGAGAPMVVADQPNDFALLRSVLASACPHVDWVPVLVDQSDVRGHLETYFDRNPERARHRHHAAVDAEALRWAWSYVNEGIT